MVHKTAYTLAHDMLRKKGVRKWIERRATIIGFPYLVLIWTPILAMKGEPDTNQKIATCILFGWAIVGIWWTSGFQMKAGEVCREARKELDLRSRYWKRAIVAYAVVIMAVAVAVGIVMPYL